MVANNGDVWEYFMDESYYNLYAVRKIGDKDFNSEVLFHVCGKMEAQHLCAYLNRLEGQFNTLMLLRSVV